MAHAVWGAISAQLGGNSAAAGLGQQGNRPNAGIEPKDSMLLFEQSILSTKQYPNKEVRFTVGSQGNVHRFEGTNG